MALSRRGFLASSLAAALVGCGGDARQRRAAAPATATTALDPSRPKHLQGPYAPVGEERTLADLEVTGTIPPELTGTYVRNGPHPWPVPAGDYDWFTGDGMVHGVRLEAGRATWYRNRWIRTAARGEDPGGAAEPFPAPNMANTSVVRHGGRTMALYEVGLPHELDDELGTVGRLDPAGGSVVTAHPKADPATGELHLFGYVPTLRYAVLDRDGRLLRSTPVDVGRISMMHDFSLTGRWAVFYDLPVVFDPALVDRPLPFRWQPEGGARVGVVPRDHSRPVRWIDLPGPAFAFHTLNAYDDGPDRIVVDLARHESFLAGETSEPPMLHRWTVDLAAGRVADERLDDRPVEFPRVAAADVGRRHRHGWSVALGAESSGSHDIGSGIVWHDLDRGTSRLLDLGAGRVAGEPTHVDGWLVSLVLDQASGTSELVVLSADDPGEGVVGRVHLPVRVPVGFHGTWIPL